MPSQGGAILACNHPGQLDVFVLGYASPRQVHYMAKRELFEINPILTRLIYLSGAFPVRRGEQDIRAISTSMALVKGGKVLGMFPEGTRDRDRGLTRGRNGAVRIALSANVPIVPTAVTGVSALNKEWSNPMRRPLVTVHFGKPIYFEQHEVENNKLWQQYTDQVMFAIADLLPPALRGVYARPVQVDPSSV